MRNHFKLFLVATLFGGQAIAGPLMLDDFDANPNDDALGARSSFESSVNDDPFGQGGTTVIDDAFSFGTDLGAMIMNSGIGARQSAYLNYNLDSGPLDLSSNGVISFDFLQVDQDFNIRILLIDELGGKAVASFLQVQAGGPRSVLFDVVNDSDFANLDLSVVEQVEILFNYAVRDDDDQFIHTASLDFVLGSIRAVPAPNALALLGLGGLVAVKRRR